LHQPLQLYTYDTGRQALPLNLFLLCLWKYSLDS
jgi:hypothetical protein